MKNLFILALLCANLIGFGQDSLKVMYHNILKFPSSTPQRVDSLRIILQYAKPDVYVVQELQTQVGADLILNEGLNVYGATNYQRAQFFDGYDTDNGFFYNTDKLGLVSQQQIGTSLRDISEYVLYYKAPNLTAQTDTIYLHFFSCHLKAGTADYEQRNQEALQLKYYLNDISDYVENVFVGGDFNFYSGYESGCQTLLNFGSVPLEDPVDMIGNWSGNSSFSSVHTQSTRINWLADGAGGGLDDRFDLILVSEDVFNNQNGVTYISNSYSALGQDGNRFDGSIVVPTNSSIPDSVSNALYYASDHLPVTMMIKFDETAGEEQQIHERIHVYYNPSDQSLNLPPSVEKLTIYDITGRKIKTIASPGGTEVLSQLKSGVYIWKIERKGKVYTDKFIVP